MVGSFPEALVTSPRWSPWSLVERDGHLAKLPKIPKDQPWRPFAWAEAEAKRTHATGLGFQLGNGWVGVDLDKCRDASTELVTPAAGAIVAAFCGAYISPSVSGTGVHVLGKGPVGMTGVEVNWRTTPASVSLHDNSWWFAMVEGDCYGDPLRDITTPLLALRARPPKDTTPMKPPSTERGLRGFPRAKDMNDDELLTAILESGQSVTFVHLFRGEWQALGKYTSQSEADLALTSLLAWWTDFDRERVDRVFRLSGLMRPKWERPDYRERAFAKAGC